MALIDEVAPLEGARELIAELKERGHTVILASSAKADEVEHYVDLLVVRDLVDGWTTSADVEQTKPAARPRRSRRSRRRGGDDAVMVGDSIWDCEAAKRAKIRSIGVLTGGFSREELRGGRRRDGLSNRSPSCVATWIPLR